MKRMNLRRTLGAAVLIGGTIVGTNALADPSQGAHDAGYGMGPGMMGDCGHGYGMGAGMMGGYGSGHGMGAGMMGGYGSGHGMGAGMMGGYGSGHGMGAGMMGGYGQGSDLNLSAEQRSKIGKIRKDVRRKHWELMGKMQDVQSQMEEQYDSDKRDDATLSKSYRQMSELRHQMFDLSLAARKDIDAVLTKEQLEKQRRG